MLKPHYLNGSKSLLSGTGIVVCATCGLMMHHASVAVATPARTEKASFDGALIAVRTEGEAPMAPINYTSRRVKAKRLLPRPDVPDANMPRPGMNPQDTQNTEQDTEASLHSKATDSQWRRQKEPKTVASKKVLAPIKVAASPGRTTTLRTSAASRMVIRRAGSLAMIPTEKLQPENALPSVEMQPVAPRPVVASTEIAVRVATTVEATEEPPAQPDTVVPVEAVSEIHSVRIAAVDATTTDTNAGTQTTGNENPEPVTGTVQLPASTPAPPTDSGAAASTSTSAGGNTPQNSRLYAPHIYYDRGTIVAQGDAQNPVRLESADTKIIGRKVILDTVNKTVRAEGSVRVERQVEVKRFQTFQPPQADLPKRRLETVAETFQGENFEYNYGTKQGKIDTARIRLTSLNITAEQLIINGQKYIASNVIIRPGGLSDQELKIYGTPPFNLRAREVIIDKSSPAPPADTVPDTEDSNNSTNASPGARTEVKNAALYFRNLRLLPVPSALLGRSGDRREESQDTYQLTPRAYYNSSDGLLLTVELGYPLMNRGRNHLDLRTDVGVSTRVGFRGGIEVESQSPLGKLSLGARLNDVVSTQLTNRIELDRLPEFEYRPPTLRLLRLPGSRLAGLSFGFTAGEYKETFTNGDHFVEDSRLQTSVRFTTRLGKRNGPYFDAFARTARYSDFNDNFSSAGFEIGYVGSIGSHLNGQISYTAQNVNGHTPFRFDRVEIRRELRSTIDILLTPRYIIPLDLRYDLDRGEFRDKTFGILRNYKTFAYGVVYQTARKELRLELRQGFR